MLGRIIVAGKLLGIAFLIYYFLTGQVKWDPLWILVYLSITCGIGLIWLAGVTLAEKLNLTPTSRRIRENELDAAESLRELLRKIRAEPWQLLLIPGEDGLFFLPLLYIGITPLTVLIASSLFAFAHLSCKPWFACLGNLAISCVLCLVVLPHGILPMIIGHVITDLAIFAILPFIKLPAPADDLYCCPSETDEFYSGNDESEWDDDGESEWDDDEIEWDYDGDDWRENSGIDEPDEPESIHSRKNF